MKKCPKCTAELPDEAVFCNNCGANLAAPVEETPVDVTPMEPLTNNSVFDDAVTQNKNRNIGLIAVVGAVAVLLLIVICVVVGGITNNPKGAIKGYMKAFQTGNANKLYGYLMPKKCLDEYYDDIYDLSFSEYVDAVQPVYTALWDGLKDEGKVKVTYDIKKCENLNELKKLKDDCKDNYGIKDLDDFIDAVDDRYDDYGVDADKIKTAYFAEVKWEVTVDKDKAAKGTSFMFIYKYKGKFYIYGGPDYYSVYGNLDYDDYEDVREDVYDALQDYYDEIDW